jgi:hypothetical protein
MDIFTTAYVRCALWAEVDDSGDPLDDNYSQDDIDHKALKTMVADCERFQRDNWDDIAGCASIAGHDFWLTRNGHGSGFWDGDWDKETGERLTKACEQYDPVDLFVANGVIHAI